MNYLLEELPQLETINDEQVLSKYLPWSKELPDEIQNIAETELENEKYKELTVVSEI